VYAQFDCLNFHKKRYKDSGLKLSLIVKSKWSIRWMEVWFYYRVLVHRSSERGKSIFTLHSRMTVLDYQVEPQMNCPNTNTNDAACIWVSTMIGGCDIVEEFLACGLYPLSIDFGFGEVSNGTTVMSKVVLSLPVFPMT
jgi:hypothetical protein